MLTSSRRLRTSPKEYGRDEDEALQERVRKGRERELSELYWHLQHKVHTDPSIRPYLHQLSKMLRKLLVTPSALNEVGLEMSLQNRI